MNLELRRELERVARRIRRVRLWSVLACCWLAWAIVGAAALYLESSPDAPFQPRPGALLIVAALSAAACSAWALASVRDPRFVARRIEQRHPELASLLLAAIEQRSAAGRRMGYLQASVVADALQHRRSCDWGDAVPNSRMTLAQLANVAALALFGMVFFSLSTGAATIKRSPESLDPAEQAVVRGVFDVIVEPGDAEVERGAPLIITAEFPQAVPPDAALAVETEPEAYARRDMARSLADPKFAARLAAVGSDLKYFIEFAGTRSEIYQLSVFDYPALVQADAELEYPAYTGLEPALVEDTRRVTATEGTELTLRCTLNKPVASATLVDEDGEATPLALVDGDANVYAATWKLDHDQRLKLRLLDEQSRQEKAPVEFFVNVTPNRAPEINVKKPGRDLRVSPIEEMLVQAEATDDFGVTAVGVSYSIGDAEAVELELAPDQDAARSRSVDHLIDFEALDAQPDQLAAYHLWAEDTGPDGATRRVVSDLFFAEVRHFEEIFREGEQPTDSQAQQQQQQQQQGGGSPSEQAEELAELQKQIVTGTWNLLRRDPTAEAEAKRREDVEVLVGSQQAVLEQLEELAGELQDEQSLELVAAARTQMQASLELLTAAAAATDDSELAEALTPEKAAYQALLKLRAREFEVSRGAPQQQGGASSGSASGSGSRSQQQLQQLELSAEENRYETESAAQRRQEQQQDEARRQSRELLDKLRDLARRQTDLNERLRELQSALEEAKTDEERERLERELKRLREQQQEILRDADETGAEMELSENAQQMQQQQEQLQEARENARQASEALEEGRLSQAISESARAGRQLGELRDQFRQQTADRFSEEMTDLRQAARELDDRQQELSEQIGEEASGRRQSLRDGGRREELNAEIESQRERLEELLEEMRSVVQEAEEPEPLLARQLYETVREAERDNISETLEGVNQLLELGVTESIPEPLAEANEGISELRANVETAAESVLGDETEGLRRALGEVGELAEQISNEIAHATGQNRQPTDGEPSEEGDRGNPDSVSNGDQPGTPGPSEQSPTSDQQPGDPSPAEEGPSGRQQSGEQQPGEQQPSNSPGQGAPGEGEQPGQSGSLGQGGQPAQGGQPGGASQSTESQPSDSPNAESPQDSPNGQPGQSGGGGGDSDTPRNDPNAPSGESAAVRMQRALDGIRSSRGGPGAAAPITGEDFRGWADRLLNVQEMLDDPELSGEAATILDRAEAVRAEVRRHSKEPDWEKLQEMVADPLVELADRIEIELRRRESPDSLTPIDRDDPPPELADVVRRYYERLGSGE